MRELCCAECFAPVINTGRIQQIDREIIVSRFDEFSGKVVTEYKIIKIKAHGLGKWECIRNRKHNRAMPKPKRQK